MRLIDADELVSHLKRDPLYHLIERYGIESVIETRPTVKAIPLEVVEQIRAEILDKYPDHQCTGELTGYAEAIEDILEIIDEAIKEQS